MAKVAIVQAFYGYNNGCDECVQTIVERIGLHTDWTDVDDKQLYILKSIARSKGYTLLVKHENPAEFVKTTISKLLEDEAKRQAAAEKEKQKYAKKQAALKERRELKKLAELEAKYKNGAAT